VLTNQHTDINVTYSQGMLGLSENNKSVDPIEYYPARDVILEFLPGAERPQTSDPRFAFLGAGPGNPVWIVPISPRDPNLLQFGVSGELIDSGILGAYRETDPRINPIIPFPWIRLAVLDVRGPGYFSMWQTDDFGNPTVWVATAGNPNPDLFFTGPGGHVDYNWAFSAPGDYQVDVRASAFLTDFTPVQSCITTYHFQVDDVGGGSPAEAAHPADPVPDLASRVATAALIGASAPTVQQVAFTLPPGQPGAALPSGREAPTLASIDQAFAVQHEKGTIVNPGSLRHSQASPEIADEASIGGVDLVQPVNLQPM
jgi:surface-anchored protein